MSFACVLHFIMSSCALHHHVFKTCIHPGLLVPSVVRFEPNHTCTRPRHVRNIILLVAGKCSRNGLKVGMRCCYVVGRSPAKFHRIRSPFDAPSPMRQVSSSYSPTLPSLLLACFISSCHHVHCIIMFSKLASARVSPFLPLSIPSPDTLARARGTSEILFL